MGSKKTYCPLASKAFAFNLENSPYKCSAFAVPFTVSIPRKGWSARRHVKLGSPIKKKAVNATIPLLSLMQLSTRLFR